MSYNVSRVLEYLLQFKPSKKLLVAYFMYTGPEDQGGAYNYDGGTCITVVVNSQPLEMPEWLENCDREGHQSIAIQKPVYI